MVKKVSLSIQEVQYVAKLARLNLSSSEAKKIGAQLSETIAYVNQLREVNTSRTTPTSNVTGLENITRDDTAKPSLEQNVALSQAKHTHNGFFKVKAVLNKDG